MSEEFEPQIEEYTKQIVKAILEQHQLTIGEVKMPSASSEHGTSILREAYPAWRVLEGHKENIRKHYKPPSRSD